MNILCWQLRSYEETAEVGCVEPLQAKTHRRLRSLASVDRRAALATALLVRLR